MKKVVILSFVLLLVIFLAAISMYAKPTEVNIAIIDTYLDNPDMYNIEQIASFSNKDRVGTSTHGEVVLSIINQNYSNANIYYAQLLDENLGATNTDTAKAIRWCVDQNVDIISMSFAGKEDVPCIKEAIEYAKNRGITLVAACINKSDEACYPAMYDGVISVSEGGNNSADYILDDKKIKYEYNGREYNITSSSYYTAYITAKIAHEL